MRILMYSRDDLQVDRTKSFKKLIKPEMGKKILGSTCKSLESLILRLGDSIIFANLYLSL